MQAFVNSVCLLCSINPPEYSDTLHGIECTWRPGVDIQPVVGSCHENTFGQSASCLNCSCMHTKQQHANTI